MCPNFHRSLSHGHLFLLFAINVQMPLGVPLKRGTLTTKWYAEITKESSVSWSKIWTVSSGWIGLQTHLSILRKKNGWVENNWFVLTFINKITNDWYFIASDIHYFFDHILFKLYEKIFSVNLKKIEICLISLKMTPSIPRPKYCICAQTIWSHWANWLIHSLK